MAPHSSPGGCVLSPSATPFPQKLVDRVRSGQFIEMRELLIDNISLLKRLDALGQQCTVPAMPGVLKPWFREITSLVPWLYCFMAYVAMRTSDPLTEQMLAYGRLLIREAQQHDGLGWLDYDRVFRQQVAVTPSLAWNRLHSDIQGTTILGRSSGRSMYCVHCFESDHASSQCALNYFEQPASSSLPTRPPSAFTSFQDKGRFRAWRRPESLLRICVSWNKGKCVYPGSCSFRHVCAICHRKHMARDCPDLPEESEYRQVWRYLFTGLDWTTGLDHWTGLLDSRPHPLILFYLKI